MGKKIKARSIVTKYDGYCIICGRPTTTTHHLIEGSCRQISDKWGLVAPVCDNHHNMSNISFHKCGAMESCGHMIGQLAYEKEYYRQLLKESGIIESETDIARESFRKLFGKSYL